MLDKVLWIVIVMVIGIVLIKFLSSLKWGEEKSSTHIPRGNYIYQISTRHNLANDVDIRHFIQFSNAKILKWYDIKSFDDLDKAEELKAKYEKIRDSKDGAFQYEV